MVLIQLLANVPCKEADEDASVQAPPTRRVTRLGLQVSGFTWPSPGCHMWACCGHLGSDLLSLHLLNTLHFTSKKHSPDGAGAALPVSTDSLSCHPTSGNSTRMRLGGSRSLLGRPPSCAAPGNTWAGWGSPPGNQKPPPTGLPASPEAARLWGLVLPPLPSKNLVAGGNRREQVLTCSRWARSSRWHLHASLGGKASTAFSLSMGFSSH